MLQQEKTGLNTNTKQEAHKDRRLYAAVPFRAATDRRLLPNDMRVLMLVCGLLDRGAQVCWAQQQSMADALSVSQQLIHRHVRRLEAFGYLVALAPKVRNKLATVYGVIFDPEHPPTRAGINENESQYQSVEVDANESQNQPDRRFDVVPPGQLVIAWRGLCFDYSPNELELRHFQELSTLGATPAHLAQWYQPGRDLIGYYMSQARASLK